MLTKRTASASRRYLPGKKDTSRGALESAAMPCFSVFFFNNPAPPEIYPLPPPDALPISPPAGSPTSAPPEAPEPSPNPQPSPAVQRPVSWRLLLPNIAGDQKRIWSFPAKVVEGHHWIPTAAILGTTAGLVALDATEASYFRHTSTFQGLNGTFTSSATAIGTIAAPVSLYAIGLI